MKSMYAVKSVVCGRLSQRNFCTGVAVAWLVLGAVWPSMLWAENISDQLIGRIIEKQLPVVLYEHKDKPWQLGIYSLTVKKSGASNFVSTEKQLQSGVPLEVIISGKINQSFMGDQIAIKCTSQFATRGQINIVPIIKAAGSQVSVTIDVPIPDPYLDCGGFQLPIKAPLEQLVVENKLEWQQKITFEINKLFAQAGI